MEVKINDSLGWRSELTILGMWEFSGMMEVFKNLIGMVYI